MVLMSVAILAVSLASSICFMAKGGSKESLPSSRPTMRRFSKKAKRTLFLCFVAMSISLTIKAGSKM